MDKTKLTYQRRNLWRAPELLRLGDNCPSKGSVKGDVYSFGIILFQLVGEIGPWGTTNITQLGTVELRVLAHGIKSVFCLKRFSKCHYEKVEYVVKPVV